MPWRFWELGFDWYYVSWSRTLSNLLLLMWPLGPNLGVPIVSRNHLLTAIALYKAPISEQSIGFWSWRFKIWRRSMKYYKFRTHVPTACTLHTICMLLHHVGSHYIPMTRLTSQSNLLTARVRMRSTVDCSHQILPFQIPTHLHIPARRARKIQFWRNIPPPYHDDIRLRINL